jgi:primosomal protein N' (replication factor Y)
VLRLDADVGGKRQVVGKANVIISTGLVEATREISKVTLVGVISADTWLNRPDFRAAEVTFRFLMQAAARAGQAGRKGHLVIQTYQPDHYAIKAAAAGDCAAFYEVELAARREHAYPPFSAMAGLVVSARAQQRTEQVAKALAETIRAEEHITLLGPIPAPLAKLKGRYRSQMLVLADDHEHLLRALRSATAGMPRNLGGVSVQVDVDPLSLV